MATPYRLGENAKLYWSATPTTTLAYVLPGTTADNIKDVKVGAKRDTPEYTTRGAGGSKQYASSLRDLTVTFQIKVPGSGSTDAAYTAFRDAWKSGAEVAAFALTDAKTIAGAEGPAGNFVVSDFSIEEGNGAVLFANVELKPSSFNDWYVAP
jgi:hypothetical protein